MKAKKLLALMLTLCLAFSCIAVIPFTATVASADGEPTATATTTAIYVGPSTRYAGNVPSGIFLPLAKSSKYGDDTIVEITADVKMLSGTKPYVQMMRTATTSSTGTVPSDAGSVVFYQGDSNNGTVNEKWQDNNTSRIDENGVFHCYVRLDDIPGEGNCFYSSVWDGGTEYRKTNIPGRGTPIGCGVFIGNTVLNDNMSVYGSYHDLSMEFLIKDIHIRITTLSGGSGGAVGDDLAPATTTLNEGEVFYFVGDSKMGNRPDAKNHPLNGALDKWNIVSSDEDTVRQVTVADDTFDGGTHTYTQHAEDDYSYEYYTCADFGNDVKFEKIGNCYSRYLDDDAAKKAFIIKSHAGDSKGLTSNQGSSTVANIFIPINIHKFYSAYNASTCGSADLREDSTAVRFGVSFKAKRISGTGQPVVGVAYANGNASGASGSSYKDTEFGAPREYGKDRSYNNGLESNPRTKQSDWVSSSYDASTGEFTALLSTESGYYKQMSRNGKTAYISIGLAEHLNSSLESLNTDSTFVISDIKFTVYELNNSSTVKFSGANQAPKMTKANCDVETPYQYCQLWDNNEKVNGTINVGVRNAPINKYSVDGAVQNVFLTDKNQCNSSGCTLTKHAATDTTIEYYECSTHGNRFEDEFASIPVNEISATKQMVVVKQTGERVRGAFIPLDNDGWVGYKSFIFKCKMKIFGDELPIITRYRSGYWGGVGTFYETGFTAQDAKDGVATQWVDYDPETMTYTAAFSMWRADPKSYNQFKYYESDTGAHSAIMLSNFIPTSGQNPGVTARRSATGFAFTDPEIYEAVDAAAGTYTGSNLCAPISSYTANNQSYAYANATQLNGSGEWTDRNNNTIMTAPLHKWSKYGNDSYVSFSDIPDGFFSNENTPKMVMFSGTGSNYNALAKETFLSANEPYQLDFDYRVFGGTGRIQVQYATSGGYSDISDISLDPYDTESPNRYTLDHEEGAHYSLRFKMPEDARITYDGNFKIYIGQADASGKTKKATTVYVANFSLVRLDEDGEAIGYNSFPNGGFYFGNAKTSITPENFDTVMFGWDPNTVNNQPAITSYKARYLYNIPEGFFEGDNIGTTADGQGGDDLALRFVGGPYANYRFDCDLPAGEGTYELSFNYRGKDDDIKLVELQGPDSSQYCTMVDSGIRVENGRFTRKYTITTTAGFRLFGDQDANGRFLFNVGDYSSGKEFYIANVSLRKKVNGTLVGPNLVGDLNPILTSDIYPVSRNNFTIADGNNDSSTKVLGHGWMASGTPTQGFVCSVDKVSDTFFNHYTTAQRLTYMQKILLNNNGAAYNPYSDTTNPYYAPINGSSMTILDLVKIKKDACTADDEGGAGVEANALKTAIMNSGNNIAATSNVLTINHNSYSAAQTAYNNHSNKTDLTIKIAKEAADGAFYAAFELAPQGTIFLLERGGEWGIPSRYEYGITLKAYCKIGTYGTGAKPIISNCGHEYASSDRWTNTGGNIWRVEVNRDYGATSNLHDSMLPGLIYCFNNAADTTPALVGNHDVNADGTFNTKAELTKLGDVYYATNIADFRNDPYLYMYCDQNPGTKYGKIKMGLKRPTITAYYSTVIDGINIQYSGGHGIYTNDGTSNVTIRNCEIGFTGGAPNGSVPYGNGVQFSNGGSNLTIDHCYVYHCFDAGITFQSYSANVTTFDTINFTNNLLTNNFYNIEFFTTGDAEHKAGSSGVNGIIRNVNIRGNIMRFAGETYSWNQRYDYLRCANICVTKNAWYLNTTNVVITENIFDCTMVSQIMWTWKNIADGAGQTAPPGTTITNNSYFQKAGSHECRVGYFGETEAYDYAGGTNALATAVARFDTSPARVKWVNRADKY